MEILALCYSTSINLGDEIQTISAICQLNRFIPSTRGVIIHPKARIKLPDILLDRDIGNLVHIENNVNEEIKDKYEIQDTTKTMIENHNKHAISTKELEYYIILNGWFDGRFMKWPISDNHGLRIKPIITSLHINEEPTLVEQPGYSEWLEIAQDQQRMVSPFDRNNVVDNEVNEKISFNSMLSDLVFWKKHEPIGTRDLHTLELFKSQNIAAYYSSCLTLTLDATLLFQPEVYNIPRSSVYIVDVDGQFDLPKIIPSHILKDAIYLHHEVDRKHCDDPNYKFQSAMSLLEKYCTAKFVITSRIHAALPCLAFYTPVLFLKHDMASDCRFDTNLQAILGGDGTCIPKQWNWNHPFITMNQFRAIDTIKRNFYKQFRLKFKGQL